MPAAAPRSGLQFPTVIDLCPCGSGQVDAACCGRFHAGAPAPTAVALMRSRYSAYVRGLIDYVVATHDAASRDQIDRAAATAWSQDTTWQGLEIVATERGGEPDDSGIVEFIARGITKGVPFAQHERSRFRKVEGRWYYVDGAIRARAAATPGRNDLCPCGSGKKYKRCHG
ncbi:MAG: YchJ family protein [Myxococcales bacterium]|nr:YchJ family protein [Myxococcales bacterium]